jgi:hypothetical protein
MQSEDSIWIESSIGTSRIRNQRNTLLEVLMLAAIRKLDEVLG